MDQVIVPIVLPSSPNRGGSHCKISHQCRCIRHFLPSYPQTSRRLRLQDCVSVDDNGNGVSVGVSISVIVGVGEKGLATMKMTKAKTEKRMTATLKTKTWTKKKKIVASYAAAAPLI